MNDTQIFDYAWKWFEYHAAQRLLAFRFYIIFFGILVVALSSAIEDVDTKRLQIASTAGAFVSLAFLVLEIRNEDLVNVGRNALKQLELHENFDDEILQLANKDSRRHWLMSHKTWIRAIYGVNFVAFVCVLKWPGMLD